MSVKCQERTSVALFDHLVGSDQQIGEIARPSVFKQSPQTALLANDLDHSHQRRINQEQRVVYDREPEGSKFRQVCDYRIR